MDWGLVLQIIIWGFAALGLIGVLIIAWFIWDNRNYTAPSPYVNDPERGMRESLKYLDNEVRGTISTNPYAIKKDSLHSEDRPTLKGRVDMIEKHLGIEVKVEPALEAELKVVKRGKK